MSLADIPEPPVHEQVLSPVDRVSEMLFGLFMALTFVGTVSIADSGRSEIREMFVAALGCNLAWGLVDSVMFLIQTMTNRGRLIAMLHAVHAAEAGEGCRIIKRSLSQTAGSLVSSSEIETVRARIVALRDLPDRPSLKRDDLLAAVGIFLIVVAATFPVVLPFLWITDVGTAKDVSRVIAIAMLFFGGLVLGRYAGNSSLKVGFIMAGLGSALVIVITALGG